MRDLLVETAERVFGRDGGAEELERSGLLDLGQAGDLHDVAAVIRVSAYHATDLDFADRVMPDLGDARLSVALTRAIQITGALARVRDLTVRYAADREQFGQRIDRFQAVQHELAELAGEAALADAAVSEALHDPSLRQIAIAKVASGHAAGRGAAISHQIHGAVGVTLEHQLHRFTMRLWRWRDEGGSEAYWSASLGKLIMASRSDQVWEGIAG